MAAAKTSKTKTKTSKTTKAVKAVKTSKTSKTSKASKTTKAKPATKVTTAKKTTKTSKPSTTKSTTAKNPVTTFLNTVVKNATKELKSVQAQTKKVLKDLNAQDKQLAALYKQQAKATSKTRQSLDTKITKLQTQMSATRTTLLSSENGADKIATLIEWVEQLNAKPSTTAYLATPAQTPSRPTLVQNTSSKYAPKSSTKAASKNTPADATKREDLFDEEEFNDDELYPEDEDDELGFAFGDEDEEEAGR